MIPSFFRPSLAWLFALLIPIIIFYFLKMRRTRLEISSLALWRQVINDQRVNAPFQKFKRNILLYLQMLLLCLLALAAMQPYWGGDAERLQYLPILIDCSASMGAKDSTGKTRLDLAKEEISKIIEGMLPGQRITLITLGATTRRITEFTDNKPLLRKALSQLNVDDVACNIADGLRLAQALSRTQPIERVRLYSDGNLPTKPNPATGKPMAAIDFDLTFSVDFFQVDEAGGNVGITAFNARRSSLDQWDVFVRVDGSEKHSAEAEVFLFANNQVVGQEQVVLNKGESQRLVFSVDADVSQDLKVEVKPSGTDAMSSDNAAWLSLPKGREVTVYCPKNLATFRHALAAIPGVLVDPPDSGAITLNRFDLLISDNIEDVDKEAALSLFVGFVPTELTNLIQIQDEPAEVVDWQRDATILQHVQLKEVIISEMPIKNKEVEDTEIEQLGFEILAYGNKGPLLLRHRAGIKLQYFMLFHTDRSTLPYRVGFPVLCNNVLSEAMQLASLSELRAPTTGVLPAIELSKNEQVRVTSPDGKHESRSSNETGILRGVSAPIMGEYEVRSDGKLVTKVGVGLLNADETSLLTIDKIQFNEIGVDAEADQLEMDKPLWPKFALAAFFVLLFEWWYFQKKPTGIPD